MCLVYITHRVWDTTRIEYRAIKRDPREFVFLDRRYIFSRAKKRAFRAETREKSERGSFADSFLSLIVRPRDSVPSNSVLLFAMDSYKRGTLGGGERIPEFFKGASLRPKCSVCLNSAVLTRGGLHLPQPFKSSPREPNNFTVTVCCRRERAAEERAILGINFLTTP